MKNYLLFIACIVYGISCRDAPGDRGSSLLINQIPTHCASGGEPNLFLSDEGIVFLSWVEYIEGSLVELRYSTLMDDVWTEPITVASGTDWFVNWADFPSIVTYKNGGTSLAAHWLQMSGEGTYDYDVHISQSLDGGQSWNPPFILHDDGVSAEHGFVSMIPLTEERLFVTWLDGRNTKLEEIKKEDHGHHGAMSLRSAEFDQKGAVYNEVELDNKVCDCCQTSAALTENGPVVVYRNRSEHEIRDIYIVRKVEGNWIEPKPIFNDEWRIAGCPVNGPVVKAHGNIVIVAWFSMADGIPMVKVAFSKDGGTNFDMPINIDDGNPLGRVDLALISAEEVLVSWLEQQGDVAIIKLAKANINGEKVSSYDLVTTENSRHSGFPQMVRKDNKLVLAWTSSDSIMHVKSGLIDLDKLMKNNG